MAAGAGVVSFYGLPWQEGQCGADLPRLAVAEYLLWPTRALGRGRGRHHNRQLADLRHKGDAERAGG